jgi:uridine kinase
MKKNPILIGIAGGSGSGKTWIAEKLRTLLKPVHCTLLLADSYYFDSSSIPFSERQNINFDHPEAIDKDLLAKHIIQLKKGEAIHQPIYDFNTHCRANNTKHITPGDVLILEGILILYYKQLREQMNLRVFVHTDDTIRFRRRLKRDIMERGRTIESITKQYQESVLPMYKKYVEPTRQFADIIIHGEKNNSRDIYLLAKKIQAQLP